MKATTLDRALRQAGALLILGLLIQVATLLSNSADAFVIFLVLGVALVLAGIVRYLLAVLRAQAADEKESNDDA